MALLKDTTIFGSRTLETAGPWAARRTKAEAIAEAFSLQELGVVVAGGYGGNHVAVSRALGNFVWETGKKVFRHLQ